MAFNATRKIYANGSVMHIDVKKRFKYKIKKVKKRKNVTKINKKLSYRRVTARCVLSVVILPITTQQFRNYLYDKS